MAKQIALFGKGGTGKSTIAANLAAALGESGQRTLLVGCGPTTDCSHLLAGDRVPVTLLSLVRGGEQLAGADIIVRGFAGVGCIEAGDSAGSELCTSRSVATALDVLRQSGAIEAFAPQFVIYDLPGDAGCVGEAMLETLQIDHSLVVTSADFRAIFAANRLIGLLSGLRHYGRVSIVVNDSTSSFEEAVVEDFAGQVGLGIAATIPRSLAVRHSELYGRTVIEAGPLSTHAYIYRRLARLLIDDCTARGGRGKGVPLEIARLKEWARDWGKKLGELEFGIIQDGAGI